MGFRSSPVLLTAVPSPQSLPFVHGQPFAPMTMIATGDLIHTLTQSLHSKQPLGNLAETLGIALQAEACLFIGRHQNLETMTLALWQEQVPAQVWQVPMPSSRPSAHLTAPQFSFQEDGLALLHQLLEGSGQAGNWQANLQHWLGEAETCSWLGEMRSHWIIPFQAIPEMTGVVLLMSSQERNWPGINEKGVTELRCLVTLAFHQHHLHQQAHQSIEQLRYLNHLKDDFLSTLSHELRTPLTSMMLAIRMLRRPDLTPERKTMYLDILDQQCSRETALVNDLLTLQSLETGNAPLHFSSLNFNHFLRSLIATQQDAFGTAGVGLQLDLPPRWITLETEPSHLTRVIQELLTNARKYAEVGTVVTVSVENDTPESADSVVIKFANEGKGIQPDELPHVFDKFRRGQGATQRAIPGTGTGLALVKGLVQQLQGSISVTSHPLSHPQRWQTCFTLCLPKCVSARLATG